MEVSVEKLAKISGVSVRTLHYYDEIGLLKPAIRLANGRRCYGTEECLRLMEILYFKKTRFSLKKIKSILDAKDLNKIKSLLIQKDVLLKEIQNLNNTIKSIDRTISHYKGDTMTKEEILKQFKTIETKMSEYEKASEEKLGKEKMDEVRKITEKMSKEEIDESTKWVIDFFEKLVDAIKNDIAADSPEIQSLIEAYFAKSKKFGLEVTKEECLSRRKLLCVDLSEVYKKAHPKLPEFLSEAIDCYANSL